MRLFFLFGFLMFFVGNNLQSQKANFAVTEISKALVENANAVVRVDEMFVDIKSKKEVTVRVNFAITIMNPSGEHFRKDHIGYSKDVKIKKAEIHIFDASGKEIKKIKKKEFKDRSAVDGVSLYTDNRIMYVDYTSVTYPYTFQISYEHSTSNSLYIPNWYFLSGYQVSTAQSLFTVNYNPEEIELMYKEFNFGSQEIHKNNVPGKMEYRAKNLGAIPFEHFSPRFEEVVPLVTVAPRNFHYEGYYGNITNWNDFGKWFYNNLLEGRDQLSEATINQIKELTKNTQDPIEKAKIVYDFVQQNTRYVSVQVGIGGFQPIKAADVDRLKYGDCKGLTNYTMALLEAVGVASYYTHVEAGQVQVDLIEDFPSIEQANHVILAIPHHEDYTWIDCTSQRNPFGFIGAFTDNRNVLVMKPEGGEITKTVAYVNEDNIKQTKAVCKLEATGSLSAKINIKSKGTYYYNRNFKEANTTDENIKKYKNEWSRLTNVSIQSFLFNNDKESVVFEEEIDLKSKQYASKAGDRLIMTINLFDNNIFVPNKYDNRQLPVKLPRGYKQESHYTIGLPEGYSVESVPNSVFIESKFGSYQVTILVNDDKTLGYTRTFLVNEGTYPKEDFEQFRAFFQEAALKDNAKIVFIKN